MDFLGTRMEDRDDIDTERLGGPHVHHEVDVGSAPQSQRSLNSVGASLCNLSVVLRVNARHANPADYLAIDHDRDTALHEIDIWYGKVSQSRTTFRDNIFHSLGRPAKLNRGEGLAFGDAD